MKTHLQALPIAEVRFVNGVRPDLQLHVQAPIQAIASTASLAALDFRQSTAKQSPNGGEFFTFHHLLPLVLNLAPFILLFYFVFSVKSP